MVSPFHAPNDSVVGGRDLSHAPVVPSLRPLGTLREESKQTRLHISGIIQYWCNLSVVPPFMERRGKRAGDLPQAG